MNIVFFGSSQFALPSLKRMINNGERISCVVTQPDRKKGRGLHYTGTSVKEAVKGTGFKIYQPENINTDESIRFLKGLAPELFIVISYGQILSKAILDIPRVFAVNAHASLLPKFRGAAPISWAIIRGETTTGVTVIKMTEKMDAGPVILQKQTDIEEDYSSLDLEKELSELAAEAIIDALNSIKNNDYKLAPQDETRVSYAPKLKKDDGLIDWAKSAIEINNLIRGCFDWPGANTYYRGKLLKIYKAKIYKHYLSVRVSPGQVINAGKEGISVATGTDDLIIEELQLAGGRRMKAADFVLGHKVAAGEILIRK